MPFIEVVMNRRILFALILLLPFSGSARLQLNTKGFLTITDESLGCGKAESYIFAEHAFSPSISLYFSDRLDGGSRWAALPENSIPFDNNAVLGLRYDKKHNFSIAATNDVFAHADELMLNFYSSDSTVIRKLLSSGNMFLKLNGKRTAFSADLTYFRLNYDLLYGDNGITKAIDDDLWSEILIAATLAKELKIGIGTFLKNDFNEYGGYDFGDHHVDFGGDHMIRLGSRKLYLDWLLSGHWRISEALYLSGGAEGPAAVIQVRPMFRLRNRIFIKAAVDYDLSKKMQKQRYRFDIRKSWRNRSSINIGYWSVPGSAIPRQAVNLRTLFFIADGIGISPNAEVFWRYGADNAQYRYYRTTASLEAIFQFRVSEIIAGLSVSQYKDCLPFNNRMSVYIGISKW